MPTSWDDYPPVMDTADVAELLQLNVETVSRMVRDGRIPARKLPGSRLWRFMKDELQEWLKSQELSSDRNPRDVSADVQDRT